MPRSSFGKLSGLMFHRVDQVLLFFFCWGGRLGNSLFRVPGPTDLRTKSKCLKCFCCFFFRMLCLFQGGTSMY